MLNFKKRIKFIALELHIIHFAHIQFHLFCIYLFIYLLFVFLGEQIDTGHYTISFSLLFDTIDI